jgi:hypothetical protein
MMMTMTRVRGQNCSRDDKGIRSRHEARHYQQERQPLHSHLSSLYSSRTVKYERK